MSRRDNAALRCKQCRMWGTLCVCTLVPRLETRTKLVLVMHCFEQVKPTNSGQLAVQALVNSEIVLRGATDRPPAAVSLDPARQTLLLFPAKDAVSIEAFATSARPVTLVVPDGTWRQASKVRTRVAGLRDVPCVTLPDDAPTTYRLRAETQDKGLSTMEAIARAFGVLEGPHLRQQLETLFTIMVERTLWLRGALPTERVTGGVPEAALEQRRLFNLTSRS